MLILCSLLLPEIVLAQSVYRVFSVDRFDMGLSTDFFKTESNYDASGGKQALAAGSNLQLVTLNTSIRYVLFNDLGLYSGLTFNNVQSANALTTRTNSHLAHFYVGGDYQLLSSDSWSLYADVSYAHPNEKIDINQDAALASDAAAEAKVQLTGVFGTESFRGFARAGYDYRTQGLSALLIYGFGAEVIFSDAALGLDFAGYSSASDDEKTSTPSVRETLTNRVNAGSKKFFSINPGLLDGSVYFSYAFNPDFIFKVSAGATVMGSNTADGYHAGVGFNWGFGGGPVKTSQGRKVKTPLKKIENKSNLPDSEPGFQIDTQDGVNQDLFKTPSPVPPKK